MIVIGIALGWAVLYFLLELYYFIYWIRTPAAVPAGISPPLEGVTVVVVARNEAQNISRCLQGLLDQDFPSHLLEIIVVDDHSTDNTVQTIEQIEDPRIHVYRLQDFPAYIKQDAYKKSGITLAVDKAAFENIVITDADCFHPKQWLGTMVTSFVRRNMNFQTAPVLISEASSLMEKMQEMEQLVLMLITGSGITSGIHDMANGANMIFRKRAFLAVNGYEGNEQYASGDDMFLIEKMRKAFPDKISFVKSPDAAIFTQGKKDWSSLLKQRLRWSGKNAGLENKSIHRIWFFIGTYHAVMLLTFLTTVFQFISAWPFIIMLCVKWTMDYALIAMSAAFFKRTSLLKFFVVLQVLYSYYILRLGMMIFLGKKGDWEEGRKGEG